MTGGFGTQTAAVCAAGFGAPGGALLANVEEYDGSSWSEVTDLPAVRGNGFAWGPSQSDGIYGSGGITNQSTVTNTVFTYDGTNWTTNPAVNNARNGMGSSGTSTAALIYGGRFNSPPNPTNIQAFTESFDGSSWTATGTLNVARDYPGGAGTANTSALAWAGSPAPAAQASETFELAGTAKTITTS